MAALVEPVAVIHLKVLKFIILIKYTLLFKENTMSSKAANYNIQIDKYASFELKMTWKTGGDSPTPITFNGAKALMQVRRTIGEQDVLFEASSTNGKIVLHPTNGLITISFSETDTDNMTFSDGVYDIIVKLGNGKVYRVLEGSIKVIDGVSKFT